MVGGRSFATAVGGWRLCDLGRGAAPMRRASTRGCMRLLTRPLACALCTRPTVPVHALGFAALVLAPAHARRCWRAARSIRVTPVGRL
eukprot:15476247-Alexandrium_andersonii.AAC.1